LIRLYLPSEEELRGIRKKSKKKRRSLPGRCSLGSANRWKEAPRAPDRIYPPHATTQRKSLSGKETQGYPNFSAPLRPYVRQWFSVFSDI
jgi:hypothetical protein